MIAEWLQESWATAAHPYSLEINGVDVISKVPGFGAGGSTFGPPIHVEMPGPGSNGSMTFTIVDPGNVIGGGTPPQLLTLVFYVPGVEGPPSQDLVTVNEWDEVKFIEHAAERPILFGGFVQSVRYVAWATTGRNIEVQCVGYGILLDKKVVPSFATTVDNFGVGENVVSLVNRHGGRLTALAPSPHTARPDATAGVVGFFAWAIHNSFAALTVTDPVTLRGALQAVLDAGVWGAGYPVNPPVNGSLWVDSGCRVICLPDVAQEDFYVPSDGDYRFSDTLPGIQVDTAGTYRVVGIEYEREDTDRVTSAYVDGTGSGIGWFRSAALEQAGDLEGIVSNPASASATDITTFGGSLVARTASSTARGTVTLESGTPLEVWPGRHIDLAVAAINLTADEDWRITGVRIAFMSAAARTYSIDYGGSAAAPSAMNRSGRYAIR